MAARKQVTQDAPEDPRFLPVMESFEHAKDVTSGRLMASFGLKVKGKIFAMSGRGKLVVKLPRERVDELIATGVGERFDPGRGRLMKEWIAIGGHADRWIELAREAYRFVG